jgi:hypothetical protein
MAIYCSPEPFHLAHDSLIVVAGVIDTDTSDFTSGLACLGYPFITLQRIAADVIGDQQFCAPGKDLIEGFGTDRHDTLPFQPDMGKRYTPSRGARAGNLTYGTTGRAEVRTRSR